MARQPTAYTHTGLYIQFIHTVDIKNMVAAHLQFCNLSLLRQHLYMSLCVLKYKERKKKKQANILLKD